ncbi:primary-amine oxidase [Synechococcus sp. R3-13]|uniref:primary-amine oxidase n=1 Tax=Synechococcus sp. R3-13 TaxID=2421316 RepID=UPI0039C0FC71
MLNIGRQWPRWLKILVITVVFGVGIVALTIASSPGSPKASHPLDPLTAEEIKMTASVIRKAENLAEDATFVLIDLREPDKAEVLSFQPGDPFRREAFAIVYEPKANRTHEAIVDLMENKLVSWTEVTGVQPAMVSSEFGLAAEVVKADPGWQEAMRKRGITDFDRVAVDCWAPGNLSEEEKASGNRFCRGISYYKGDNWNYYGAPIEGVLATVNLNTGKVSKLIDDDTLVAFSKESFDYDLASLGSVRPAPKPLKITHPGGASYDIKGNEITWQGWKFRYLMHPREGLVLYTARYQEGEEERPVFYRVSLSEMVVPYGDPDETWYFRNAFDVGEYNFGLLANTMELGKEVPENGLLLDAVFADNDGEPYVMPGVIGLYERDNGMLWKHYEYNTKRNDVRRSRELVMTMTAAIGNYDYGISWVFHQDGTFEVQADLTGIVLAKGTDAVTTADADPFAPLMAPNVGGTNHQHYFSFRLDMDVDGTDNAVMEMNLKPLPQSPDNPAGNAFIMEEKHLLSEKEAVRDLNMASSRKWVIVSSSKTNALGAPTGYALMPGPNAMFLPVEGSNVRERAGFATHHFWATHYQPGELYAAGPYPNQSGPGEGLPKWVSDDQPLEGEDLVVWYSLGVSHVPRPEDWPVMPVHRTGFRLVPWGFFDRNPTINLAEPA